MPFYKAGIIYGRCFVQKRLEPRLGALVIPLDFSGSAGTIHDARRALQAAGARFSRHDLDTTLANFAQTGATALVRFDSIEAPSYVEAIDSAYAQSEPVAGALSVLSANAAVALCGFADGLVDSGVRFFIPPDRVTRHGTNIPGYLDAVPALCDRAASDAKFGFGLQLFRASMREERIEYRVLFQLVLLEELSDDSIGNTLAARLRSFLNSIGVVEWLASVARELNVVVPPGKDAIDLLVQLRNAAAHSGRLDSDELRKWAEWAVPAVSDLSALHKAVTDVLRHIFCAMVGFGPDRMAMLVSEPLKIRFD